jgi:hypothetical protein
MRTRRLSLIRQRGPRPVREDTGPEGLVLQHALARDYLRQQQSGGPWAIPTSMTSFIVKGLSCLQYGGMVAKVGLEPTRSCHRPILSLFFGILQRVAIGRKLSHKVFIINRVLLNCFLQSVAEECTKVGNEQQSKQPLNRFARGAVSVAFAVPWPTWFYCSCSRYVLCSRKREHS